MEKAAKVTVDFLIHHSRSPLWFSGQYRKAPPGTQAPFRYPFSGFCYEI